MTNKNLMLNILEDGEWHCFHEFSFSSQPAAIVRDLIAEGYEFESNDNGKNYKHMYCPVCKKETIHRKLKK